MDNALPKFIPANRLKESYIVFGHFYDIELNSGNEIKCRSVLEITCKKSQPIEPSQLSSSHPDAIVIMMNPGSSEPLAGIIEKIKQDQIVELKPSLVLAKPDITQYQIMRVMHYCDWSHVRVLNLSDIRDPDSGRFADLYKNVESVNSFKAHSIFSDVRAEQLKTYLLNKPNSIVICAWGVNSNLDPLIAQCLDRIRGMSNIAGLLRTNSTDKYFHPLPRQQIDKNRWVSQMVRCIKDLKPNG